VTLGRVSEGSGEDPLGSQIAKAMVKGYQGDDLSLITLFFQSNILFIWCT
jgi:beta-glucosidase-like glycosyl hydrolase